MSCLGLRPASHSRPGQQSAQRHRGLVQRHAETLDRSYDGHTGESWDVFTTFEDKTVKSELLEVTTVLLFPKCRKFLGRSART